ncbi:MAG: alpha/beta fold hydrolase, partial [Pseudomonadota bacterium]
MAQGTEKATFVGSQGDTLSAALDRPEGEPVAFVLFAHCFSCTKDIKAAREIARALRRNGFGVLRFDFTGLGASSGEFGNTNFSSNVEDLVRAADFLREHYQAPSIMIGHSLGGSAVIVAGQRVPEVQGIVTIGAPSEAAHVAHQFGSGRAEIEEKGEAIVQLSGRPFSIKKQFLEDIEGARVRDAAASLKKPLLIMHAPHDETVGIDNASALFVAAKHPKSFVSLDTADHLLRDAKDARYAAETIAAWSSRYLDASGKTVTDGPATSGSANTGSPSPASGNTAPAFKGGALAVARSDAGFAADLSIDGHP